MIGNNFSFTKIIFTTLLTFLVVVGMLVPFTPQAEPQTAQAFNTDELISRGAGALAGCLSEVFLQVGIAEVAAIFEIPLRTFKVPGTDGENRRRNTGSMIKESCMDAIGYAMGQTIRQEINDQINSFFGDRFEGNVGLVLNLARRFQDIEEVGFRNYLRDPSTYEGICSGYRDSTVASLVSQYRNGIWDESTGTGVLGGVLLEDGDQRQDFFEVLNTLPDDLQECELAQAFESEEDMRDFLGGDFSKGGWDAWLTMVNDDKSNPINSQLSTIDRLYTDLNEAVENEKQQLEFGRGFLTQTKCVPNGGGEPQDPGIGGECPPEYTLKVATPAATVESLLTKLSESDLDQVQLIDEISEAIAQLTELYIGNLLGADGNEDGLVRYGEEGIELAGGETLGDSPRTGGEFFGANPLNWLLCGPNLENCGSDADNELLDQLDIEIRYRNVLQSFVSIYQSAETQDLMAGMTQCVEDGTASARFRDVIDNLESTYTEAMEGVFKLGKKIDWNTQDFNWESVFIVLEEGSKVSWTGREFNWEAGVRYHPAEEIERFGGDMDALNTCDEESEGRLSYVVTDDLADYLATTVDQFARRYRPSWWQRGFESFVRGQLFAWLGNPLAWTIGNESTNFVYNGMDISLTFEGSDSTRRMPEEPLWFVEVCTQAENIPDEWTPLRSERSTVLSYDPPCHYVWKLSHDAGLLDRDDKDFICAYDATTDRRTNVNDRTYTDIAGQATLSQCRSEADAQKTHYFVVTDPDLVSVMEADGVDFGNCPDSAPGGVCWVVRECIESPYGDGPEVYWEDELPGNDFPEGAYVTPRPAYRAPDGDEDPLVRQNQLISDLFDILNQLTLDDFSSQVSNPSAAVAAPDPSDISINPDLSDTQIQDAAGAYIDLQPLFHSEEQISNLENDMEEFLRLLRELNAIAVRTENSDPNLGIGACGSSGSLPGGDGTVTGGDDEVEDPRLEDRVDWDGQPFQWEFDTFYVIDNNDNLVLVDPNTIPACTVDRASYRSYRVPPGGLLWSERICNGSIWQATGAEIPAYLTPIDEGDGGGNNDVPEGA